MNGHVPALVAERFPSSRIVAYSTACVYPMTDVASGGSVEGDPLTPDWRICQFLHRTRADIRVFLGTQRDTGKTLQAQPLAIDMRYGVLPRHCQCGFQRDPGLAWRSAMSTSSGRVMRTATRWQLLAHVTTTDQPDQYFRPGYGRCSPDCGGFRPGISADSPNSSASRSRIHCL